MSEAVQVFTEAVGNSYLEGKPVLVLANKQDLPNARTKYAIKELFRIDEALESRPHFISECSAFVPYIDEDDNENCNEDSYQPDSRIESSLEELLNSVLVHFDRLNDKVNLDSQAIALEEMKRRMERERKVLKSKIACAFAAEIAPEILATLSINKDDPFDEGEGLSFLAAEIGEEASGLPPVAVTIARDVGFQRLALQMVGALKAPISKKKAKMEWEEIATLVAELREELGLPLHSHISLSEEKQ
jgi:hypothetical protein